VEGQTGRQGSFRPDRGQSLTKVERGLGRLCRRRRRVNSPTPVPCGREICTVANHKTLDFIASGPKVKKWPVG